MNNIYVTAFPKSGSTWLTRLLADCLNCPADGSRPDDDKDWVKEGWKGRKLNRVVRRGHFTFTRQGEEMVPIGQQLNWDYYDDSPFILLVRDPRDVAVSLSFHLNKTMDIGTVHLEKGYGRYGRYGPYCQSWINSPVRLAVVRYEDLLVRTEFEVSALLHQLQIPFEPARIQGACERQSFKVRKAAIQQASRQQQKEMRMGQVFHLKFMRKGKAGDWVNFLNEEQAARIVAANREFMEEFGYA